MQGAQFKMPQILLFSVGVFHISQRRNQASDHIREKKKGVLGAICSSVVMLDGICRQCRNESNGNGDCLIFTESPKNIKQ